MSDLLISPADVEAFYNRGQEELGKLLIGETEAKIGMLVGMVSGLNVVLVGEPGGGKTTLAANSYRLIDGIDPLNIAEIPPLPDLAPQQLVGGKVSVEREVSDDSGHKTEKTTTHIKGLVTPDTQVLFANEINRLNPDALDGVLEAFESGLLTTPVGNVKIKNLEYGVATMNPSERHEGTVKVSKAMTSRFAIGSELGADETTNDAIIRNSLKGRGAWKSSPDKIEPITDIRTLQAMRRNAKEGVAIPEKLAESEFAKLKRTHANLKETGRFGEAPGRFITRTVEVASTLAYLRRNSEVTEKDMNDARKYLVLARIGVQGVGGTRATGVTDLVRQITEG